MGVLLAGPTSRGLATFDLATGSDIDNDLSEVPEVFGAERSRLRKFVDA